MPDVLIHTPRGQMPCYLAVPLRPRPAPGVVVLHDVGGMSQDHRNQADWLAEDGFLALAVDLYYLGGLLRCIRSIINYGGKLPPDVDDFLKTACPVVGSYGGKSRWEHGVADQLEQALQRALIAHDVKEYPDAGHSFMNNKAQFLFKLLRFSGIAYNEAATLDARRRIAAFFHTHLQG
jgi:carboxymethylenebutenolidase